MNNNPGASPFRRVSHQLALLLVAVLAFACGDRGEPRPHGYFVVNEAPTVSRSQSAVGDAARNSLHAILLVDQAVFGRDTCNSPSFKTEFVDGDSLLRKRFNVSLVDLGYRPPPNHIFVTRVECFGKPWESPLGLMVWKQSSTEEFYVFDQGLTLSFKRSTNPKSGGS
jgi:hypothetical protein